MTRISFQFILIAFLLFNQGQILAQGWELAKEKDGIKIYTRVEEGSKYKAFRGETEFRADFEAVGSLIEDVKNFEQWDDDVSEIRVLEQERGKMLKYYVVYDVPWPFADRDLCVEAIITLDQKTGTKLFNARSVPEAVPQGPNVVRIENFWQKWIIQQKENSMIHLTIEGYADPAGDIPAWITNMAITRSPLKMLRGVRDYFE